MGLFTEHADNLPHDFDAKESIGVQISACGTKLWVCVDGQCVLRARASIEATQPVYVTLDDQRN